MRHRNRWLSQRRSWVDAQRTVEFAPPGPTRPAFIRWGTIDRPSGRFRNYESLISLAASRRGHRGGQLVTDLLIAAHASQQSLAGQQPRPLDGISHAALLLGPGGRRPATTTSRAGGVGLQGQRARIFERQLEGGGSSSSLEGRGGVGPRAGERARRTPILIRAGRFRNVAFPRRRRSTPELDAWCGTRRAVSERAGAGSSTKAGEGRGPRGRARPWPYSTTGLAREPRRRPRDLATTLRLLGDTHEGRFSRARPGRRHRQGLHRRVRSKGLRRKILCFPVSTDPGAGRFLLAEGVT